MITPDDISTASERIKDHVLRTPVATLPGFGLSFPIDVKFEQMQHMGNFKVRGAFNTMRAASPGPAGYVAASGGNHGASVAHAAKVLGHKAQIFVPEFAGPAKIGLIRSTGAALTVVPGTYAEAAEAAAAYQAETGATQIHPFDAPLTIAGQGTLMQEWEEQGLVADTVLIAVGGGGLIAGAMGWLGSRRRIIGVEPDLAPTLTHALDRGPETEVDVSGVAVNALGARRIGRMCYDMAIARNLTTVTVPDAAITAAQHALWQERRQLVEPAGAAALAALICGAYRPEKDERVAVLICGANPSLDPFA